MPGSKSDQISSDNLHCVKYYSNGSSNYFSPPPPRYLIWLTNWDACLLGAAILLDTCLVLFMAGGRSEMCCKFISLLLKFGLGMILIDGFDVHWTFFSRNVSQQLLYCSWTFSTAIYRF